jgi:hypothetical protein
MKSRQEVVEYLDQLEAEQVEVERKRQEYERDNFDKIVQERYESYVAMMDNVLSGTDGFHGTYSLKRRNYELTASNKFDNPALKKLEDKLNKLGYITNMKQGTARWNGEEVYTLNISW